MIADRCASLQANQRLLQPIAPGAIFGILGSAYWGHEFDLLGSRDVIGYVIFDSHKPYVLLVVLYWKQSLYL